MPCDGSSRSRFTGCILPWPSRICLNFFCNMLKQLDLFSHQESTVLVLTLMAPSIQNPAASAVTNGNSLWASLVRIIKLQKLMPHEIDGVGPIDNKQLTPEMWRVTCDMWYVTDGGAWTFTQNFSSLALTVWDLWCLRDCEEKDTSVS